MPIYLHPNVSIDLRTVTDMNIIPRPLPATVTISTNSRFFLKYCPIMISEQSRVIPIPRPRTKPICAKENPHKKRENHDKTARPLDMLRTPIMKTDHSWIALDGIVGRTMWTDIPMWWLSLQSQPIAALISVGTMQLLWVIQRDQWQSIRNQLALYCIQTGTELSKRTTKTIYNVCVTWNCSQIKCRIIKYGYWYELKCSYTKKGKKNYFLFHCNTENFRPMMQSANSSLFSSISISFHIQT